MTFAFDANILVYAVDEAHVPKAKLAQSLLIQAPSAGGVFLLQAQSEFSHVALRKLKWPVERVEATVRQWRAAMPVHSAAPDDLPAALDAVARHNLSFWDAMLWATANRIGVRHLLTEDFQDGRTLGGVTFLNPFVPSNQSRLETLLAPGP